MIKDFIKIFKKRRSLKICTTFIAAILSGIPVGMFFSLVWKGPTYLDWESSFIKWIIYLIFLIMVLYFYYKLGIKIRYDKEERRNFHDNFFVGILAAILISLLIIFHLLLKESIWYPIVTIITIVILFFIFTCAFLKFRRPK